MWWCMNGHSIRISGLQNLSSQVVGIFVMMHVCCLEITFYVFVNLTGLLASVACLLGCTNSCHIVFF
jgi:hypothetical protein